MVKDFMDFEKPLAEIEKRIAELKTFGANRPKVTAEIERLGKKAQELQREIFSKLTPWQRAQIARHPNRPTTLDYIGYLMTDFIEFHGDRCFGDDSSIVCGMARFDSKPIIVIGHQKGKVTKEKIKRNFGMSNPEGYRKALRLMKMAERFRKPIITFIDTPGAYPGIGAEERGQAEAIARNLYEMSRLKTQILSIITGEGGSGGALALGIADRVLMLENSIYSVISPEGCAAILWENPEKIEEAAQALRITARDLFQLGIIDRIIEEPAGGAHRDYPTMSANLGQAIRTHLQELEAIPIEDLVQLRYGKYRKIGVFREEEFVL